MVKGIFKSRSQIKDFCVNLIEIIREAEVPVLWVLKMADAHNPSTVDLLKSLMSQALRLNAINRTERSLALSCARFQSAMTEDNWIDLLDPSLRV